MGAASSGAPAIDGTMPGWAARADRTPLVAFADSCLRGCGQVVFMNNPLTGLLILVALTIAAPWLGFASVLGLIVSTATAHALGIDGAAIRAGLYGFNGLLVGSAFATFLTPTWDVAVMAYIVAVSAGSVIAMAFLGARLVGSWGVPPLTLPFNFVTLAFLAAAVAVSHGHAGPLLEPRELGGAVDATLRAAADGPPAGAAEGLLNALFRGIGQLFFADSVIAGVLIVVGMALCSRIAALFALVGSAVGGLTGIVLGADGFAVYHGLWGYNGFVSAVAIAGVFYVLSWRTALLGVACAVAASVLFATLSVLFAPWGLSALTLPFCFATIAFLMLRDAGIPIRAVPLDEVTTPEGHLHLTEEPEDRWVGRDPVRDASGRR